MAVVTNIFRHVVMINLAYARGVVSVVFEMLRHRHHIGQVLANENGIAMNERLIRIQPCHKRSPARPAQRVLTIRPFKPHPPFSEAIDVWRPHLWMSVNANIAIQVITNQEQHIRLFRGIGGNRQQCGEENNLSAFHAPANLPVRPHQGNPETRRVKYLLLLPKIDLNFLNCPFPQLDKYIAKIINKAELWAT